MWFLGKIWESMESIPSELKRYVGKSEEDLCLSPKTAHCLHNNILTPDNIPEFCLPPRLCKRSPLLSAGTNPPDPHRQKEMHQIRRSPTPSDDSTIKTTRVKKKEEGSERSGQTKHLSLSAECYGLAGMYESPNTRRKESLLLSKRPAYILDRRSPTAASPRLADKTSLPKTTSTLFGFLPTFSCQSLSESVSLSSSSSLLSPTSDSRRLTGATSCPSLIISREEGGMWTRGDSLSTISSSSSPGSEGSSTIPAPASLFPLDVLQCRERFQREHVLPLTGRGRVRLSAEQNTSAMIPSQFTVRIRVVSVEDLRDDADPRPLNCAVSLCLTPGKQQRQESATIRNCRQPVFNEDFFFPGLIQEDVMQLELRIKVLDKPAPGTLRRRRRRTVMGVASKPLAQLLL
ncbi:C2 calcium-dependent domain-containing protein 4C [Genypterus blacodes]|uniref:C2 calcium-dependent domain-containing protein 4C n=1 Tax=Genypterus blacodes TaxID=154954 RepID=UPI003F76C952